MKNKSLNIKVMILILKDPDHILIQILISKDSDQIVSYLL